MIWFACFKSVTDTLRAQDRKGAAQTFRELVKSTVNVRRRFFCFLNCGNVHIT